MPHWKKTNERKAHGHVIEIIYRNKETGKLIILSKRGYNPDSKLWGLSTEPPLKLHGYFSRKQAFKKARAMMKND